ncbi:RHS repeat domain-containing protein [Facilibium subflavum]|uniref:RHS repeat domain-containing protein n=1 Tax=Facilibium subflavum TaxID=2219058 RepID=UPI000E659D9F|nr:RHS repeat-associated core domain-containing protein [Facilibium subflavum]
MKIFKMTTTGILTSLVLFNVSLANCQFTYDNNGNLVSDSQCNRYQYNDANQLTGYFNAQSKVQYYYHYNATGLRDGKIYNQMKIGFIYTGNQQISSSVEAGKNTASAYLQHQVRYIEQKNQEFTQYFAQSHHNQVDLILNNKLDITNQYNYTPYGQARFMRKPKSSNSDPLFNNPLGYDGEYKDTESGLVYLRARFYSPDFMHFIQRDSYQLSNRYTFANDNPINMIDPQGHSPFTDFFNNIPKEKYTFLSAFAMILTGTAVMAATGGAGLFGEGAIFSSESEDGMLYGFARSIGGGKVKNIINGLLHAGAAADFSTGMSAASLVTRGISLYKGNKIRKSFANKQLPVAAITGAATGLASFMSSGIGSAVTSGLGKSSLGAKLLGYGADSIIQGGIGASSGIAYAEARAKYVYGADLPVSDLLTPALVGGGIGFLGGLGIRYANAPKAEAGDAPIVADDAPAPAPEAGGAENDAEPLLNEEGSLANDEGSRTDSAPLLAVSPVDNALPLLSSNLSSDDI